MDQNETKLVDYKRMEEIECNMTYFFVMCLGFIYKNE